MLQVDYYNPFNYQQITDNSGLRLTLTPSLNNMVDSETLVAGIAMNQLHIPPKNLTIVQSECPSVCTSKIIPAQGIKIFSSTFNAHLLATEVGTLYYRNGSIVPFKSVIDTDYRYGIREMEVFNDLIIYPGDSIVNYCKYKSNSDVVITGGKELTQEMCINVINYYPDIPAFTYCTVYQEPILVSDGAPFHNGLPLVQCGNLLLDYDSGQEVVMCSSAEHIIYENELPSLYVTCMTGINLCSQDCLNKTVSWLSNRCMQSEGYDYFINTCHTTACDLIDAILSSCHGPCVPGKELQQCGSDSVKCNNNICSSSVQNSNFVLNSISHTSIIIVLFLSIAIAITSVSCFIYFIKLSRGKKRYVLS